MASGVVEVEVVAPAAVVAGLEHGGVGHGHDGRASARHHVLALVRAAAAAGTAEGGGLLAPVERVDGAVNAGLLRAMLDGDRSGASDEVAALMCRTGTWHLVSIPLGLHIGLSATVAWAIARVLTRPIVPFWRRGGLRWIARPRRLRRRAPTPIAGFPARRAVWDDRGRGGRGGPPPPPGRVGGARARMARHRRGREPAAIANAGCQLSFGALAGMIRYLRLCAGSRPIRAGGCAGPWARSRRRSAPPRARSRRWRGPSRTSRPSRRLRTSSRFRSSGTVATPALLASQLLPRPLGPWALWIADHAISLGLACITPLAVAPLHPAVGLPGALVLGGAVLLRRHVAAAAAAIVLALALTERPVGELVVTFLDVGQGDAALVEWPDGKTWLIDGGPPGGEVLAALRRRGVRALDTVVLSHPHPDHYGGLVPVLRALPVGTFRVPRLPLPGEADYAAVLACTRARRVIGARGPTPAPSSSTPFRALTPRAT